VEIGGKKFHLVHATPRDPMDEYLASEPDVWKVRLAEIEADYVCVGHTHLQFHLNLGRTQVLNPGSVGQPRDADPRAAYAIIDEQGVHLKRVEYDIEATIRSLHNASLPPDLIDLAVSMLRTGGRANG
jgi:predicted phosphodiesterase